MIKIKFNNPNSRTLTTIDIYRELRGTEIPDVPVNPPIATLDGFETEYVDNDTVIGNDYNYRFRVYKLGGESTMSPNYILGDVSLYGPGNYDVALSGSDYIWDLGIIDDIDDLALLPTSEVLLDIAGPGAELQNWTDQWKKFKIDSGIYFTPYRGAIKLTTSELLNFMDRVANSNRIINAGYCSYVANSSMQSNMALAVFDGRYPTRWGLDKEYPRLNAIEAFAGNDINSYLIYNVVNSSVAYTFGQKATPYSPTSSILLNTDTYLDKTWYWKPIIQFIPKPERNYT